KVPKSSDDERSHLFASDRIFRAEVSTSAAQGHASRRQLADLLVKWVVRRDIKEGAALQNCKGLTGYGDGAAARTRAAVLSDRVSHGSASCAAVAGSDGDEARVVADGGPAAASHCRDIHGAGCRAC